jgi:hypothetical protein
MVKSVALTLTLESAHLADSTGESACLCQTLMAMWVVDGVDFELELPTVAAGS